MPASQGNHYAMVTKYFFYRCRGLILLETYTVDNSADFVNKLPPFLNVLREVTGDSQYSMYNLALKDEGWWKQSCHSRSESSVTRVSQPSNTTKKLRAKITIAPGGKCGILTARFLKLLLNGMIWIKSRDRRGFKSADNALRARTSAFLAVA